MIFLFRYAKSVFVIAVCFQLGISQMREMLAVMIDINHPINLNIKPVNNAKCFQAFL